MLFEIPVPGHSGWGEHHKPIRVSTEIKDAGLSIKGVQFHPASDGKIIESVQKPILQVYIIA